MKCLIKITSAFLFSFIFVTSCQKGSLPEMSGTEEIPKTLFETTIPVSNNAYITKVDPNSHEKVSTTTLTYWSSSKSVFSVFFRLSIPGDLKLKVKAKVARGKSTIRVSINDKPFTLNLSGTSNSIYEVGTINIEKAGYVKVDFQGLSKTGSTFAEVSEILISGTATEKEVVFGSDVNNKHWDRRGVAVSLWYEDTPENTEWFYNEITVTPGEDPKNSFYMANGFTGGYFGMQVREDDRTFQYSIWNSETGKAILLEKGKDVLHTGFSHEGSGGATTLIYNWKSGNTYKFLTRAVPDGFGNTLFSAWMFAPELGTWTFIATYKRENFDKRLEGLHSFIENWGEDQGYLFRKATYSNQWARDTSGIWKELTKANATGGQKVRKDNAAGITKEGHFFAQINGFFDEHIPDGQHVRKVANVVPRIDLIKLPNYDVNKYLKK